jgi:hypothetical protein
MAYQPITTYYFEKRFKKLTKKDGMCSPETFDFIYSSLGHGEEE